MAYGIIRVANLRINDVGKAELHNARLYETHGLPLPENIIPGKQGDDGYNSYNVKGMSDDEETYASGSLLKAVNKRIQEAGIKPRGNAVVAIEYIVSASKEFFDAYASSGHFSNAKKWLAKKYGEHNVVASYVHHDESTPHAHILVVPVVQKEVKWKNSQGEGVRTENRLCARDITGGKQKLRQLQQDYYEFIKCYGDRYDVKFYRGTLAEEQKKTYVMRTNASLGAIRNGVSELETRLTGLDEKFTALTKTGYESGQHLQRLLEQHNKLEAERKEAQERKAQLEQKLKTEVKEAVNTIHELDKQIERKQKANKGKGWQKGLSF